MGRKTIQKVREAIPGGSRNQFEMGRETFLTVAKLRKYYANVKQIALHLGIAGESSGKPDKFVGDRSEDLFFCSSTTNNTDNMRKAR